MSTVEIRVSDAEDLRDLCCFNYFEFELEVDKAFPYQEIWRFWCNVCGARWSDTYYRGDPPPWEADPCTAIP